MSPNPIHFPVQVAGNVPLTDDQSGRIAGQCIARLLNTHPDAQDLDSVIVEVAIDGALLVLFVDADREIFAALHQHGGNQFEPVNTAAEIDGLRGNVH